MQKAGSCKTILLIECNALNSVDKIQLVSGEDFRIVKAEDLNKCKVFLENPLVPVDAILIDYGLFNGNNKSDFLDLVNLYSLPFFILITSENAASVVRIINEHCAGYLLREGSREYLEININNFLDRYCISNSSKNGLLSYKRLKACLEEAGVGISIVDTGGKWIEVNSNFERMLGYTSDELLNLTIHDITHPEDFNKNKDSFESLVAGENDFYNIRKRYITKNKNTIWADLAVSPIKDKSGEIIAVIGAVNEITDKINLSEKLKESEDRFKSFIDSVPNLPIQGYDAEGIIKYWNKASENLYGFSEQEVFGKNFIDFIIPEEMRDEVIESIKIMMNSHIPRQSEELYLKKKDGSIFPVLTNHTILNVGEGKKELFCVDIDLTERRKAEEQLKKYANELKALNNTKDKFLSILAHDLRGPFQGFLGVSECLANETENLSTEEIRMLGKELHTTLLRQYELLTDLLSWTRMQTGKIILNFVDFHVNYEIKSVIEALLLSAKKKAIQIVVNVPEELMVYADISMFRMLLRNLISNSIKFTNANGKILISARCISPFLEISVEDNGIGIDDENLERLFKVDARFSTDGTANEPGTGLGLILCKEIVDKHNGIITVKSQVEKGSTFTFTIPESKKN